MMESAVGKTVSLLLALCLIVSGCASSGDRYTGQQKQQLETNVIASSYDNVFNATRTVFLNEGLILRLVNKESGFINATLNAKRSRVTGARVTGTVFAVLLGVVTFGLGLLLIPFMYGDRGFDHSPITATLVKLSETSTEIRLQTPLLEKQSASYGMALKRLFAEIQKQAVILEAAGRK